MLKTDEGYASGAAGIGVGTIVVVLVAMYFGVDPRILLQLADSRAVGTSWRSQTRGD